MSAIVIIVAKRCQDHFGFDLPSVIWSKRVKKFEAKFHACNNLLCCEYVENELQRQSTVVFILILFR